MRFMSLYKPGRESDQPPTPEMIERVGRLIEEFAKSGVLLATDGLQSSAKGARVAFAQGRFTITDGPFPETKEIIGGYAILNVGSKAEAIALTKRFLETMGEGQCELRQMQDAPGFEAPQRAAG
ncbi:MAG TPA: YciI family protein [Thermoanaerobaculia bacterium]